jgi:hypothetical protein
LGAVTHRITQHTLLDSTAILQIPGDISGVLHEFVITEWNPRLNTRGHTYAIDSVEQIIQSAVTDQNTRIRHGHSPSARSWLIMTGDMVGDSHR